MYVLCLYIAYFATFPDCVNFHKIGVNNKSPQTSVSIMSPYNNQIWIRTPHTSVEFLFLRWLHVLHRRPWSGLKHYNFKCDDGWSNKYHFIHNYIVLGILMCAYVHRYRILFNRIVRAKIIHQFVVHLDKIGPLKSMRYPLWIYRG